MANWFVDSTAVGTNAGTSWTNAWTSLNSAVAGGGVAAGDTIFVSDLHNEVAFTSYVNPGTNTSPCSILCADHTVGLPLATNLKTSAVVGSGSGVAISVTGSFYCYGITFSSGGGTGVTAGQSFSVVAGNFQKFDTCVFFLNNTSVASFFNLPALATANLELLNTSVKFSSVSQIIIPQGLLWEDSTLLAAGSVVPTNVFGASSGRFNILRGVDLSGASNTIVANSLTSKPTFSFERCKFNSASTIFGTVQATQGGEVFVSNSDSATAYYRNDHYTTDGSQTTSITVYRVGGASDGTTPLAWNLTTNARASWISPFWGTPMAIWSLQVGSNRGVTCYGLVNASSVPNNDQIWFDARYFGSSASPIESTATGSKANVLSIGSALAADAVSQWVAPARINGTLYSLGSAISVPGNAGRVFFCTTSGTAGATEPAGYASAIDGGVVTDGAATFRAGCRFSLTVTLGASPLVGNSGVTSPQPQAVGSISVDWKVALASMTYYVDPMINLS